MTDAEGRYRFTTIKPGRLPVAQPRQRLAAGAHPLLAVRHVVPVAAGHADVFPERSAVPVRPDHAVDPDERARASRCVAVRSGVDRSRVGARLPLRHRPAGPRRRRRSTSGSRRRLVATGADHRSVLPRAGIRRPGARADGSRRASTPAHPARRGRRRRAGPRRDDRGLAGRRGPVEHAAVLGPSAGFGRLPPTARAARARSRRSGRAACRAGRMPQAAHCQRLFARGLLRHYTRSTSPAIRRSTTIRC